jgi:hypothetical protein
VRPAIKTATRLLIHMKTHRLVELDPVSLTKLAATPITLRRLLMQAETLRQQLPRKR